MRPAPWRSCCPLAPLALGDALLLLAPFVEVAFSGATWAPCFATAANPVAERSLTQGQPAKLSPFGLNGTVSQGVRLAAPMKPTTLRLAVSEGIISALGTDASRDRFRSRISYGRQARLSFLIAVRRWSASLKGRRRFNSVAWPPPLSNT